MYQFNDAYIVLSKEFILSKITDFDIFSKYCSNFKEINKSFCSDLRKDSNPDCRIFNSTYSLLYKDFASGECYNCFTYIQKKYNCNNQECFNIIANDFKLINSNKDTIIPIINDNSTLNFKMKIKKEIKIYERNWTWYDKTYWSKYGISSKLLKEYNVIPCKYVNLIIGDKRFTYENNSYNPIYAYKFDDSYKIYRPLANKKDKFLFNGSKDDLEGYNQLPHLGDLLIITKSLKDIICLKLLNYDAISLQGEQNSLSDRMRDLLLYRFKEIISFYDQDEAGIKGARSLGFKSILIPLKYESKDLSDLIVKVGLTKAKLIIDKLIEECIK